ncbi:MAG TPA: alpha/beta hydrolase-fold protein, partial [Gemmataceae bacterium]|nr:alpha/beta hydrolase-fold protein [Gemmataceae bacterium]
RWHSPSLGRDMELLVFGHGGARALVFPTAMGRYFDWEQRGLVAALRGPIDRGLVQLFCVDSVDAESWYDSNRPAAARVARHEQYDRYLRDEVVPFTLEQNGAALLISVGASFGGYHAVNFSLRHPAVVQRVLSLSGLMDIGRFLHGHYDDSCYYNNPVDFLAGEHDAARLEALRKMDIILAVGREDALCETNLRLSGILWGKGIWHALRIWDGFAHDWPVWARMLDLYLGGHD